MGNRDIKFESLNEFEKSGDPKRSLGIGNLQLKDQISGMESLLNFLHNAESDFIDKIWGESWITAHFKEKMASKTKREGYLSPNALISFTRELGNEYMNDLFKYISENY